MLSVGMLSVIISSVTMISINVERRYTECHDAECSLC
jgi:hypothetical protein